MRHPGGVGGREWWNVLRVENNGTLPVLLLDGEILSGAKQDRVVRSSVLVGEGSQVVVPVYCVERGRWDRSLASLKTKAHSPPSLRHILKGGSPRTGSFTQGDGQEAVWRFIQDKAPGDLHSLAEGEPVRRAPPPPRRGEATPA